MKSYRRKDIDDLHRKRIIENMLNRANKQLKPLNEMALPLKEYTKRIDDIMYQIVENWCLCKWCQKFDPENNNFNHWKEELTAHIMKLASPKLKNNIGKKKHLEKHFVEWYDLDEVPMVLNVINHKFNTEHIMDKSQRNIIAQIFTSKIHFLIDAIDAGSEISESYIAKEFKL